MSEVALIVGGGPGVSASCARLFVAEGMKVAIAARSPEKESMQKLSKELGVLCVRCDASIPEEVSALFDKVKASLGHPTLSFTTLMADRPIFLEKRLRKQTQN